MIITRKGSFDSAHRVVNEKMKCFNIHGHTYLYQLNFSFDYSDMAGIGYAMDFKEIKRINCQWIDDYLDHAVILNAKDDVMIDAAKKLNSKLYLMQSNGFDTNGQIAYCNPTVENLAAEISVIQDFICRNLETKNVLNFDSIILYETPNCFCTCNINEISDELYFSVLDGGKEEQILNFIKEKGWIEYDDRK